MKTFNRYEEALEYSVINPSETVECKSYHYDGQLYEHSFYVNGVLDGELKSYFSNGQLEDHGFYVNGLLHGEYKSYWYDGKLAYHHFYVNNEWYDVDYLRDGSYKSLCIKQTLFNGNLLDEDI